MRRFEKEWLNFMKCQPFVSLATNIITPVGMWKNIPHWYLTMQIKNNLEQGKDYLFAAGNCELIIQS